MESKARNTNVVRENRCIDWNVVDESRRTNKHLCCCEGFCTKEDYEEIDAFFKQHPVSCARAVQQALESIQVNIGILERDAELLGRFLVEFMGHANDSQP
ncbi:unnamed protein product [Rodentolepis nana]|uniref:Uncharacterized protein n=1 Tax=Rodentolepis nana TaxID=102285 RepID=A0A0R3TEW9_RODNA|nr:unnamed protein product [Rodentolepis nana]